MAANFTPHQADAARLGVQLVPTNAASLSTSSTPMPPSISSTPMPPCAPTGCSSSSSGQQQPPQPPQPWQWQWQPPALHSPPPQPTAQPGAVVGATQARGHQAGDHQGDQGRSREIKGGQGDHYAWAPPAQDQIRQQDQIGSTGLPNMVLGWELPPPPAPPPPSLTPYQAALLDQVQKEGQAKVQAAQARLQAHASACKRSPRRGAGACKCSPRRRLLVSPQARLQAHQASGQPMPYPAVSTMLGNSANGDDGLIGDLSIGPHGEP